MFTSLLLLFCSGDNLRILLRARPLSTPNSEKLTAMPMPTWIDAPAIQNFAKNGKKREDFRPFGLDCVKISRTARDFHAFWN
jgi:hypothetical protein